MWLKTWCCIQLRSTYKACSQTIHFQRFPFFSWNTIRWASNDSFQMGCSFRRTAGVQKGAKSRSLALRCEQIIQIGAKRRRRDWRLAQHTELYHRVYSQQPTSFELQSSSGASQRPWTRHGWLKDTHASVLDKGARRRSKLWFEITTVTVLWRTHCLFFVEETVWEVGETSMMLGAVKMEGHEHSDWSTYYAEPEVRTFNVYFCVKTRSRFIQLNISPEIILTLRSNIDLRRLQILPHLDARNCPYKVVWQVGRTLLFHSEFTYLNIC